MTSTQVCLVMILSFLKQFHNMLTQCVPCYALGVYKSIYLSFVACVLYINSTLGPTDYGRPMKPFFHQNPKHLCLGRQFGQINCGAFGVFLANLSAPILGTVSPLSMSSINQPLFHKKLSLMLLACHKKSYLICDEITNFRNIM